MAIAYNPLKLKSEYEVALGGDSKKISDFNKVWSFVRTIPLTAIVDNYNRLEGKRNVAALSGLDNNIKSTIQSINEEKNKYSDPGVQAPLDDLLFRIKQVETEIAKEIRAFTPETRDGIFKIAHAMRANTRAVTDAYSKFTKTGRSVYNYAQRLIDSGGSSLFGDKHK